MNPLRAAMESIAFQDKGFANSLTKYFQSILDNYKNGHDAQNSEERDQIVKLTFERTGIKINLTIDGDNSFTYLPEINNGHIFEHHWFRETANNDENVLLKRMKLFKQTSYVDLKNARVGGFFSEIESPIYVGYDLLKMSKLSAAEAAAAYLHELGHVFTTYEYLSSTITGNIALSTAVRALNKNDSKKYEFVLKELGKTISNNDQMFAELNEVTDKSVVTTLIIGNTQDWYRSESGVSNYDNTTSEALADAFCVRFGLGREIVSGLAKIHKAYGSPEYSNFMRVYSLIQQTMVLYSGPVALILFGLTFPAALTVVFGLFAFFVSGENSRNFTCDDLRVRYLRVKEQIIESLKNNKLSKTDKQTQLAAISFIEKQIQEVKSVPDVFRASANFLLPSNRRAKKAIELQRELEQLSANDIFAKAAELSVMA